MWNYGHLLCTVSCHACQQFSHISAFTYQFCVYHVDGSGVRTASTSLCCCPVEADILMIIVCRLYALICDRDDCVVENDLLL